MANYLLVNIFDVNQLTNYYQKIMDTVYSDEHVFHVSDNPCQLHVFDGDTPVNKSVILANPIGWCSAQLMLKIPNAGMKAVVDQLNDNIQYCMTNKIILSTGGAITQNTKGNSVGDDSQKMIFAEIPIIRVYKESNSLDTKFSTIIISVKSPPSVNCLASFFQKINSDDKDMTLSRMIGTSEYKALLESSRDYAKRLMTSVLFISEPKSSQVCRLGTNSDVYLKSQELGISVKCSSRNDSTAMGWVVEPDRIEYVDAYDDAPLEHSNSRDNKYKSYVQVNAFRGSEDGCDQKRPTSDVQGQPSTIYQPLKWMNEMSISQNGYDMDENKNVSCPTLGDENKKDVGVAVCNTNVLPPPTRTSADRDIFDMFSNQSLIIGNTEDDSSSGIAMQIYKKMKCDQLINRPVGVYEFMLSYDTFPINDNTVDYIKKTPLADGMNFGQKIGMVFWLLEASLGHDNYESCVFTKKLDGQLSHKRRNNQFGQISMFPTPFSMDNGKVSIRGRSVNDDSTFKLAFGSKEISRDYNGYGISTNSIKNIDFNKLLKYTNEPLVFAAKVQEILENTKYAIDTFGKWRSSVMLTTDSFPEEYYVFDPERLDIEMQKDTVGSDIMAMGRWPSNIQDIWPYDGFLLVMNYFVTLFDNRDKKSMEEFRNEMNSHIKWNILNVVKNSELEKMGMTINGAQAQGGAKEKRECIKREDLFTVLQNPRISNPSETVDVTDTTDKKKRMDEILSTLTDNINDVQISGKLLDLIINEEKLSNDIDLRLIGEFTTAVLMPLIFIFRTISANDKNEDGGDILSDDMIRLFINNVMTFEYVTVDTEDGKTFDTSMLDNQLKINGKKIPFQMDGHTHNEWQLEYECNYYVSIEIDKSIINFVNKINKNNEIGIQKRQFNAYGLNIKSGDTYPNKSEISTYAYQRLRALQEDASFRIFYSKKASDIENILIDLLLRSYMFIMPKREMDHSMSYTWNGASSLLESSFAHIYQSIGMDYIENIQRFKEDTLDVMFTESINKYDMENLDDQTAKIIKDRFYDYLMSHCIAQKDLYNANMEFERVRLQICSRYDKMIAADPIRAYDLMLNMYYEQWIALEMILSETWESSKWLLECIADESNCTTDLEKARYNNGLTDFYFFANKDMSDPQNTLIQDTTKLLTVFSKESSIVNNDGPNPLLEEPEELELEDFFPSLRDYMAKSKYRNEKDVRSRKPMHSGLAAHIDRHMKQSHHNKKSGIGGTQHIDNGSHAEFTKKKALVQLENPVHHKKNVVSISSIVGGDKDKQDADYVHVECQLDHGPGMLLEAASIKSDSSASPGGKCCPFVVPSSVNLMESSLAPMVSVRMTETILDNSAGVKKHIENSVKASSKRQKRMTLKKQKQHQHMLKKRLDHQRHTSSHGKKGSVKSEVSIPSEGDLEKNVSVISCTSRISGCFKNNSSVWDTEELGGKNGKSYYDSKNIISMKPFK